MSFSKILFGAGLLGLALGARPAAAQEPLPTGRWQGQLGARRVILTLKADTCFLGLPEDGATRLVLPRPRLVGDSLLATRPPAVLRGRFSADRRTLTATLGYYGKPQPVVLTSSPTMQPLRLPQDAVLPLPYQAEDVTFATDSSRLTLAGTLTRPPGTRPVPAVVLLSGTGPQDRNYTIGLAGHQPFRVLADYLTRRGIAVLRFDDRGTGKSTGNYSLATTADFAHDAEAAVRYLRSRPDIDPRQVGVIGHSEGGAVAVMAAAADPSIAFVVSLSGLLAPGLQALRWQNQSLVGSSNLSASAKQRANEINGLMFQTAYDYATAPDMAAQMRAVYQQWYDKDAAQRKATNAPDDHFRFPAESYIQQATSPWYRYHVRYDPAPYLAQLKVPFLAINGDLDRLVDYHQLPIVAAQLKKAGNKDVTTKVMPGDTHLLQPTTDPAARATDLAITLDPAVLQTVGDWVQRHTKTKK